MKLRRRIAFLKAYGHDNCIDDYSRDLRLTKRGSGVSVQGSNLKSLMSALGQKQTSQSDRLNFRFTPESKHRNRHTRITFDAATPAAWRC